MALTSTNVIPANKIRIWEIAHVIYSRDVGCDYHINEGLHLTLY